jgi:crossover junction endodeoxyribonuclease RuvC
LIYIGIDPGLHGAVGVLTSEGQFVFDTPTMVVSGAKERDEYNTAGMAALLRPYSFSAPILVVLEAVHSMPKQGVSSSFKFGKGLGIWLGIIAAFNLPLEMPSPQRWKKEMLADQGKDKSASRYKAIQIFPAMAEQLKLVKHDGRAEALLMAEYGKRKC